MEFYLTEGCQGSPRSRPALPASPLVDGARGFVRFPAAGVHSPGARAFSLRFTPPAGVAGNVSVLLGGGLAA